MEIIICGSMTFSKKMVEIKKELLELGHSVFLPKFTEEYASLPSTEMMHKESAKNKTEYNLIRNYYKKIKQGDAVLIINEKRHNTKNYIGGNSLIEMAFAHILNKKIFLLNPIPKTNYSDEIEAMKPIILNGDLTKLNKS